MSEPPSVSVVGLGTMVSGAEASEDACVASPGKLAMTSYEPGVRDACSWIVARPFAFVFTGIPFDPMPMSTNLSASGSSSEVSSTVTWKLWPNATEGGGGVVKVSSVASGSGAPGGVFAFPGIEPGR